MIKIFKDKKNIAIVSSLILGALGVGMSAVALTKRPPCPPPTPERPCVEHFEKHECPKDEGCPDCKRAHDEFKGEEGRECPPPRHDRGRERDEKFNPDKRDSKEERSARPEKDFNHAENGEQAKN